METKPFYSMKKKTFSVLLPPTSYRVACFNDLQSKVTFFQFLCILFSPQEKARFVRTLQLVFFDRR